MQFHFSSPIGTVHYESVFQQTMQTGDAFCLRGERRCKNTSPLSSNAFGQRRGASAGAAARRSAGGRRARWRRPSLAATRRKVMAQPPPPPSGATPSPPRRSGGPRPPHLRRRPGRSALARRPRSTRSRRPVVAARPLRPDRVDLARRPRSTRPHRPTTSAARPLRPVRVDQRRRRPGFTLPPEANPCMAGRRQSQVAEHGGGGKGRRERGHGEPPRGGDLLPHLLRRPPGRRCCG